MSHLSEARKQYDEYCLLVWPNGSILGRKHPWKVLYKDCSFSSNPLTNMANFSSFGKLVSEEIFLEINQLKTKMACGGHVC
jgi:hypothetical protein